MVLLSLIVSFGAALIEILGQGRLVVVIPYAFVNSFFALVPRIALAKSVKIRDAVTDEWLRRVEQVVFLVIAFNAPGSLSLHGLDIQYDRPLHFLVAFLMLILLLLVSLPFLGKEAPKKARILTVIFTASVGGLFLWEGFQYLIDAVFGTHLFSDVLQSIRTDFWEDILFGFAGLLAGLWYAGRYFGKFLSLRK